MNALSIGLGIHSYRSECCACSQRNGRWFVVAALVVWTLGCQAVAVPAAEPAPRLNQIQVIGTHNSYHLEPSAAVVQAISTVYPGAKTELAYRHRPLTEQFDQLGVRQVELDLFADPHGGHFAWPLGARLDGLSRQEFDPQGIWQRPGYKIMHVQDVDYRTTVPTFRAALREINR